MNILERITAETPLFFRKVIALSLVLSAAATAVLTAGELGIVLPVALATACKYCIVAGLAAAAVSKTTVQK